MIIGVSTPHPRALAGFLARSVESEPGIMRLLRNGDPSRLIVIKPNWIQEAHETRPELWEPVITSPDVLIALLECLAERIAGSATLCVCDAPHTYADFSAILARGAFKDRFSALAAARPGLRFELLDLRREVWVRKEGVVVERRPNAEDPRGYVKIDLGADGLFYGHPGEGRYYGADYDTEEANRHHRGETQEYLIAGTAAACDLFINVPKLKTHKKTGITCCLKNLVGINGDKNWLPHHTEGGPASRGDEFPGMNMAQRIESFAKRAGRSAALRFPGPGAWVFRKMRNTGKRILGDSDTVIRNGNWSGNDTCWRMALDLNRALLYANPDGTWRDRFHPKAYLAIVDGIVGGQGNGPLCPDPVPSNVLVSGTNPAEVDAVAARLMGFDPEKIPLIRHAFDPHRWPISDRPRDSITAYDERVGREVGWREVKPVVEGGFKPHFGWRALNPETA